MRRGTPPMAARARVWAPIQTPCAWRQTTKECEVKSGALALGGRKATNAVEQRRRLVRREHPTKHVGGHGQGQIAEVTPFDEGRAIIDPVGGGTRASGRQVRRLQDDDADRAVVVDRSASI
jgi:hypothetical protein